MKRKITLLEEKLIEKGLKLSHKTYIGKHSQFVCGHVYCGKISVSTNVATYSVPTKIYLDAKRTKVEKIVIFNWFDEYFTKENITELVLIYGSVENYINECEELCQE